MLSMSLDHIKLLPLQNVSFIVMCVSHKQILCPASDFLIAVQNKLRKQQTTFYNSLNSVLTLASQSYGSAFLFLSSIIEKHELRKKRTVPMLEITKNHSCCQYYFQISLFSCMFYYIHCCLFLSKLLLFLEEP